MDIFNNKFVAHLKREIEMKDARIDALEQTLAELLDAKMFNRIPSRLQRIIDSETLTVVDTMQSPKQPVYQSSEMADALSVAEADAWELSKPKENKE